MTEFLAIFIPALGYALLHFLWQGAVIGLLAALALHALRHARPQPRYAVACFALLACVLVPSVTVIAELAATPFAPLYAGAVVPLPHGGASPDTPNMLFGFTASAAQLDTFLPWVVAVWAAGTFVLSLRLVLGLTWIHRLRNSPSSPAQAAWQKRLDGVAVHFGLRRHVALRLVDSLDSPVSAGWWHPVVLLPTALLTRMPTDLIEALLAHELAHIRRHDYLINLLQNAVEALLFYHPVTWWLSNCIRIEREHIADQLAAEVACAPRHLALALSELSELQRNHPAPQLVQAARGGQLLARIERLVRPARDTHPSARIVFPLLGLVAGCIATYSYAQIVSPHSDSTTTGTHAMRVSRTDDALPRETIALVGKGKNDIWIWGPNDDLPAIEAAKRGANGDFLWIYRAGKTYVVTDPSLIARARQAWSESNALSLQMEALSDQMEVHSNKMETLSGRMEKLSRQQELSLDAGAAERAIENFERQHQSIAREELRLANLQRNTQGDTAQQQRIDLQMDALSAKRDALVHLYEQQLEAEARRTEAQQQPMDALVREMDLASKPMEALSRQMDVLDSRQGKAWDRTERELRKLIKDSLAGNLAKPVLPRVVAQ